MRGTMPLVRLVFFAFALAASVTALSSATAAASPWLGVYTQEVTSDLREGLDYRGDGVLVNRVVTDSPADRAGIRNGDVLVRFNSRSIDTPQELAGLVRSARDGQVASVEIVRRGDHRTLQVTLAERPDRDEDDSDGPGWAPRARDNDDDRPSWTPAPRSRGNDDGDDDGDDDNDAPRARTFVIPPVPPVPPAPAAPHAAPRVYRFDGDADQMRREARRMARDMRVKNYKMKGWGEGSGPGFDFEGMHGPLMEGLASRVRLGVQIEGTDNEDGVRVTGIIDGTPAERAGLQSGDVIKSVDGHDVNTTQDLRRELRNAEGSTSIEVSRRGSRRTVQVDLGAPSRSGGDDDGDADHDHIMRFRERTPGNGNGGGDAELRRQLDELRQQVRELREQLRDERDRR